jgi:formylglycine-generating enzyme required for sulfatase activity
VTIARPFAVSKFEVTFEEWDACVAVDSTIDQIIHLRTNHLAPAAAGGIEEIIEERRRAAMAAIARMRGKPPKPN